MGRAANPVGPGNGDHDLCRHGATGAPESAEYLGLGRPAGADKSITAERYRRLGRVGTGRKSRFSGILQRGSLPVFFTGIL